MTLTPSLLYSQIGKLLAAYSTSRYATPDTVVMHPRRWVAGLVDRFHWSAWRDPLN